MYKKVVLSEKDLDYVIGGPLARRFANWLNNKTDALIKFFKK